MLNARLTPSHAPTAWACVDTVLMAMRARAGRLHALQVSGPAAPGETQYKFGPGKDIDSAKPFEVHAHDMHMRLAPHPIMGKCMGGAARGPTRTIGIARGTDGTYHYSRRPSAQSRPSDLARWSIAGVPITISRANARFAGL